MECFVVKYATKFIDSYQSIVTGSHRYNLFILLCEGGMKNLHSFGINSQNILHLTIAASRRLSSEKTNESILKLFDKTEHEEVIFCHNKDAGLKAIIAIHNTVLGPALGGLRMYPYATEEQALTDVLRLSRWDVL